MWPVTKNAHGDSTEISLPTVAEILALPQLRRGRPTVEAGKNALDRLVRWVHVSEVADIARLLQGGELIFSTGVSLPQSEHGLTRYISDLAGVRATGVVIELGRRFESLPAALVQSAESHGLPLIALHAEVRFVDITEAILSIIVNAQMRQMRLAESAHRVFRSMAVEASTPQHIVSQVAQLAECRAIFENEARHALVFAGTAANNTDFLTNWEERSREAAMTGSVTLMDGEQWFTAAVTARGRVWGRLVLLTGRDASPLQQTIVELGATNLALHLLLERDEELLEHQTHRTLIDDIVEHNYLVADEIHTRAESLGVVTRRRSLIALIVRSDADTSLSDIARHVRAREELVAVSGSLSDAKVRGLIGPLEPGRIGVLIATSNETTLNADIELLARAIHERIKKLVPAGSPVIGVGSAVNSIGDLQRSFTEANEAADAARDLPGDFLFITTADIGLRGLVHLLRDDPRLGRFAERELGPLVKYDDRNGTDLVATLGALLKAGGNKSAGAAAVFMNRATFYHRLLRIEKVLRCNLDSPETRYSLYVALMVHHASSL